MSPKSHPFPASKDAYLQQARELRSQAFHETGSNLTRLVRDIFDRRDGHKPARPPIAAGRKQIKCYP